MKEFVEHIVKNLLNKPDGVRLFEVIGDKTSIYESRLYKLDMGKVIDKYGRTANAISILLTAVPHKTGKRSSMEILE